MVNDGADIICEPQMLNLEQFARKMGVCVNTVRSLIAIGKLIEGRHYTRCGRRYLFPWSWDQAKQIMRDFTPEPPAPPRPPLASRQGNRAKLRYKA